MNSKIKQIVLGFDAFNKQTLNETKETENKTEKEKDDLIVRLPNGMLAIQTILDYIEHIAGARDWESVKKYLDKAYPMEVKVPDDERVSRWLNDVIQETNTGARNYEIEGEDSMENLTLHLMVMSMLMWPGMQERFFGKEYNGSVAATIKE